MSEPADLWIFGEHISWYEQDARTQTIRYKTDNDRKVMQLTYNLFVQSVRTSPPKAHTIIAGGGGAGSTGKTKTITKKETAMLYNFKNNKDEDVYGTHLATDSAGRWVMEVKGTGEVVTVKADAVTEVLPYTVGIRYDLKEGGSGTTYHYHAKDGEFAVGDLLLTDAGAYARVISINTKSRRADKRFAGWKVAAVRIDE